MTRSTHRIAALALLILGGVGAASCSDRGPPDFIELRVERWEGVKLTDTVLARNMFGGGATVPRPSQVVLYRKGCGACAAHLASLDREPGRVPLMLIQVPDEEDADAALDSRERAPAHHLHTSLYGLPRGFGFTAPATFYVDATGTIRQVRDAEDLFGPRD